MLQLVDANGHAAHISTEVVTIGRSRKCDIVIPLRCVTVSQAHAKIRLHVHDEVVEYEIIDFSSKGSMLNGEWFRNEARALSANDVICLGTENTRDATFTVKLGGAILDGERLDPCAPSHAQERRTCSQPTVASAPSEEDKTRAQNSKARRSSSSELEHNTQAPAASKPKARRSSVVTGLSLSSNPPPADLSPTSSSSSQAVRRAASFEDAASAASTASPTSSGADGPRFHRRSSTGGVGSHRRASSTLAQEDAVQQLWSRFATKEAKPQRRRSVEPAVTSHASSHAGKEEEENGDEEEDRGALAVQALALDEVFQVHAGPARSPDDPLFGLRIEGSPRRVYKSLLKPAEAKELSAAELKELLQERERVAKRRAAVARREKAGGASTKVKARVSASATRALEWGERGMFKIM